jgi:hypothetical protein
VVSGLGVGLFGRGFGAIVCFSSLSIVFLYFFYIIYLFYLYFYVFVI